MKKRNISIRKGRDITLFAGVGTFLAIELYGFGYYWNEAQMYLWAIGVGLLASVVTAGYLAVVSE